MKDIGLPKFGSPEDFFELHDIVKQNVEQDSAWTAEITKVENMVQAQVQHFMEHSIKDQTIFHKLSVKIFKYRAWAVEVKEILSALMDQHKLSYANTCEEIFIKWLEYEKIHPL